MRYLVGIVALFIFVLPSVLTAGIIGCAFDKQTCRYAWDFEEGQRPPNKGFDNESLGRSQIEIFSGGAFSGDRFGRISVESGDFKMTGRNDETTERAEMSTDRFTNLSGEIHFGVAVRFGPEFNPHDERTLILQIKPNFTRGFKNSPQFAVYANESFDRWKVCNDITNLDECDYNRAKIFKRNVWHTLVVSQNMSKRADGWLRFYVDGELIYEHVGPTKYNRNEAFTHFRVGIYRNNVATPQRLDVDNFIVSRDLDAVASFLKLDPTDLK